MNVDRETEMNLSRREIRVLLLHEFFLGHKTTEATNNICRTMGQDIISTRTAQRWFNRFNNGNLNWTIHVTLEDQSKWIWTD